MNCPKSDHNKSDHKEYPKTFDREDLWGQVRRTVNGKPVSEEQIAMIVAAIRRDLQLRADDVVLDLACGNGALSSYLFEDCARLHGVDWSEFLIEIANSRFAISGKSTFLVDDAAHYVGSEPEPGQFTKALCYGSFAYFSEADATRVIDGLARRFANVTRVFIGNLPDLARAGRFYYAGMDYHAELKDHTAQIGVWRSEMELRELFEASGWKLEIVSMPPAFYAAHYRFDAILTR
jgi:cyclopropane fatty-acyl-phospholipid synthase-like methyltransferase